MKRRYGDVISNIKGVKAETNEEATKEEIAKLLKIFIVKFREH